MMNQADYFHICVFVFTIKPFSMLVQTKPAGAGPGGDTTISTAGKMAAQSRKKPVFYFLHRVYPTNWFSEFCDISITLEEFAPAKTGQENSTRYFE
jgi:hypothetical protein